MRYGSLFAGYGGLELGVQSVLGGTTAWHCEVEPAPSRVLAHHWPTTPNLGDITQVPWADVEPIDILTGGFPCQDVSHAGKRLGLKPGTRSGLWAHMAYAIDQLRPHLVVAENVRGLLSAEAGGDLEPCPWCVGDGERGALRALGAVLGDLADLRYDAQWIGVRAADAGAPHGRFRIFVFAWPADTSSPGLEGPRPERSTADAADADADGVRHERCRSVRGRWSGPADCREPAADASGKRHGRGVHPGDVGRLDREAEGGARQRERAREVVRDRGAATAADTDSLGRDGIAQLDASSTARVDGEHRGHADRRGDGGGRGTGTRISWGAYEPAIRRWEHVLGRVAPAPTEPSAKGSQRLSPAFVEFMMGLPAGHVTDPAIGLTRNEQLKALGNGVVPQQAALATRMWLASAGLQVAA